MSDGQRVYLCAYGLEGASDPVMIVLTENARHGGCRARSTRRSYQHDYPTSIAGACKWIESESDRVTIINSREDAKDCLVTYNDSEFPSDFLALSVQLSTDEAADVTLKHLEHGW